MARKWTALAMAMMFLAMCMSACITINSDDDDDDPPNNNPPAHTVYATGTGICNNENYMMDFDSGRYGNNVPKLSALADLVFQLHYYPQNGALFAALGVVDYSAVTYEQVSTRTLSSNEVKASNMTAGKVVVYKTSQGRYGKLRVITTVGDGVTFDWITWN